MSSRKNRRKTRKDKISFSQKEISQIEAMAGLGLTREDICNVLGVSSDTLLRRLNEGNEQLAAALKRGKAIAKVNVSQKLYNKAVEGNPSMIKFYMTHQGGWGKKKEYQYDEYGMPYLSYDDYRKVQNVVEYEKEYNAVRFMTPSEFEEYKEARIKVVKMQYEMFTRLANGEEPYCKD